ncbi:MAG: hypothetical protein Kow00114_11100 [Kiloniellaceae bacterium]
MLRACVLAAALAGAVPALPGTAAANDIRPIEGHENWRLGMTLAEAEAAEPRAERRDCAGATCLQYADERFPTAAVDVSARFNGDQRLDVIVVIMKPQPGDNRCKRISAQLAAFYTAAHGETMPVSAEAWVWTDPRASLTLLNHCDSAEPGVINILFEALALPGAAAQ